MDVDGYYENLQLQNNDDVISEDVENSFFQGENLQKILQSDIRRYKRVGVGVGLLCAVLALLNIAVPLSLNRSNTVKTHQLQTSFDQLEAKHKLLTEERDQLQISNNNLTNERDGMQRMLCESSGWQTFDRGLYYISTEKKTWDQSRQWCRDNQSDLIVINSKEKQDFVKRVNKRVWLGLSDRESEGSFQWVDGTPLTTPTYWMSGNPDNDGNWYETGGTEDCVEFYDGSNRDHPPTGWNDGPCSFPNYWICERAMC